MIKWPLAVGRQVTPASLISPSNVSPPAGLFNCDYNKKMILKQLTNRIRQGRASRRAEKMASREQEQHVRQAVERLVDEVNPKIRAVSGYRRKLSPAVQRTLAFSKQVVSTLPSAVIVSKTTWNSDPRVRALFSSIDDLQQVYSGSQVVREFFDRNAGVDECYALLSMKRSERTVLGMELHGEVMKRDIKQTSVSFSDHRVVRIADTEPALRGELEDRAFEVTVAYLLEQLNELITSRNSLEERNQLQAMQLRLARARQASLLPLLEGEDVGELQEQQRQTNEALDHARARLTTLDDYIDRMTDVLAHPEQHLKLDCTTLRLSKMNIKLDRDSTPEGYDLDLNEITLGRLQRVIMLTRFHRGELLARKDFFKEAERRLY